MTTWFALLLMLAGTAPQPAVIKNAIPLAFHEFLAPSTTELKPSDKLRSLNGKRVRILGFMAEMEHQPEGYFYLCSRPILCDESGGGIGELPIDAVRVVVRSSAKPPVKFVAPPLAVTGTLELGGQSENEQDSWAVRILVEDFNQSVQLLKPITPKPNKKIKR